MTKCKNLTLKMTYIFNKFRKKILNIIIAVTSNINLSIVVNNSQILSKCSQQFAQNSTELSYVLRTIYMWYGSRCTFLSNQLTFRERKNIFIRTALRTIYTKISSRVSWMKPIVCKNCIKISTQRKKYNRFVLDLIMNVLTAKKILRVA